MYLDHLNWLILKLLWCRKAEFIQKIKYTSFITYKCKMVTLFDLSKLDLKQTRWINAIVFVFGHIHWGLIERLQKFMVLITAGNEDIVPLPSMSYALTKNVSTFEGPLEEMIEHSIVFKGEFESLLISTCDSAWLAPLVSTRKQPVAWDPLLNWQSISPDEVLIYTSRTSKVPELKLFWIISED